MTSSPTLAQDEKGLIGKNEILERVKRLQAQTQLRKRPH